MRKHLAGLTLAALAAAGAGCTDTDPIAPGDTAVGEYALTQVNGAAVPYAFQLSPLRLEITSGSMRLERDGTFVETVTVVAEGEGAAEGVEEAETRTGWWSFTEGRLELTSDDGAITYSDAVVRRGVLTYTAVDAVSLRLTMERE